VIRIANGTGVRGAGGHVRRSIGRAAKARKDARLRWTGGGERGLFETMTLPYLFEPIGFVRSPFTERAAAPRQAVVGRDATAVIELVPGRGYEHAVEGLGDWEYAWVIFVFHKNVEEERGWRAKVLAPRSSKKRGVFATRSPHRPNPIGLSAVRLEGVDGLTVRVKHVDLLDGTPVLDIKPYVAYADAFTAARSGWLEAPDPLPAWQVAFGPKAREELAWLRDRGVDLAGSVETVLVLGPEPHPYRRIRPLAQGMRLSVKDWRVDFEVEGRRIVVVGVSTGYRAKELATDPALGMHRAFVAAFG
jgi:tRNA (adenine37-N6)-methyltransferase